MQTADSIECTSRSDGLTSYLTTEVGLVVFPLTLKILPTSVRLELETRTPIDEKGATVLPLKSQKAAAL